MPRSPASRADQALVAFAAQHGASCTTRQIERWRAQGLLPPNIRRGLGRGAGSASDPLPSAGELVIWLAMHARRGRRPGDLALLAFGAGLAVPEATVRTAFSTAVDKIKLPVEDSVPTGSTPDEIVDAAVTAGSRAAVVPARVRRIDKGLAELAVPWSAPELRALDPGPVSAPVTAADWTHTAAQMVLSGGSSIDLGMLGALARSMLPADAAAPVAARMEYGWPGNENEAASLLTEEGRLAILPSGDLRNQLRDLAATTPFTELLDAWRAAEQLPRWATGLCDAVEREIAEGRLGLAAERWWLGSFGPSRLWLTAALRGHVSPTDTAGTALGLALVRNAIRGLRELLPDGRFDLLREHHLVPTFLLPFYEH